MINYIVYGNTDYLDVLQIQSDYISGRGNLTLFLNTNDLDLTELLSNYDKVIYYDNACNLAEYCYNRAPSLFQFHVTYIVGFSQKLFS